MQSFFTLNNLAESFFMDHKYRESSLNTKGAVITAKQLRPSKDDWVIVFAKERLAEEEN